MKKFILLFFSLLISYTSVFSIETNSIFSFVKQSTAEAYQQYVGQSFIIRAPIGELETWNGLRGTTALLPYEPLVGKIYTITKIKVTDVVLTNNNKNRKIHITAIENSTKKKITFYGYEEHRTLQIGLFEKIQQPLISNIPIIFTQSFEEFKRLHMGEIIEHAIVKDQYEIVDIFIGKGNGGKVEPYVKVKNKRTNEIIACAYSEVKEKPFEIALKGIYMMRLVKVENSKDVSSCNNNIKIIQDNEIDKFIYCYKDSIIDINICGSPKQFEFVIKNISEHSIKIIWDEASFVGLDGFSSKIMHNGIKFSERTNNQLPTTIVRGAKLADVACPIDYVNNDGSLKFLMIPKLYIGNIEADLRLMLPIQIKDVTMEYTFIFNVDYIFINPEVLRTEKLSAPVFNNITKYMLLP